MDMSVMGVLEMLVLSISCAPKLEMSAWSGEDQVVVSFVCHVLRIALPSCFEMASVRCPLVFNERIVEFWKVFVDIACRWVGVL